MLVAHQVDELFVHGLHHLLSRRDALQHLLPESTLLDACNERPCDLVVDVRFQQRTPHLSKRLFDVGLGQLSVATKFLENAFEFIGQQVEHSIRSRISVRKGEDL